MDLMHVCTQMIDSSVTLCSNLFSISFWFDLLLQYKYWIVVIGALVEGEIILMIAASSAYYGHISVYYVAIFAILGAIIHDHALYALGYYLDDKFQKKKGGHVIQRIYHLIDKYGIYLVVMFRFLYGIRTITPLVLGASRKFSLKKYSFFVCASAVVWALIITYLGYTFAAVFEWLVGEFKRIKNIIFYTVLGIIIIAGSIYLIKKLSQKK